MKIFKNVLYFILIISIGLITAPYLGRWYDTISPQYGSAFWGPGKSGAVFFAGMLVSYVFFIPFIYGILGIKKNKYWIIMLLIPAMWLWLESDRYYIYIPIALIAAGLMLASLLRYAFAKLRRSNPPVVIK